MLTPPERDLLWLITLSLQNIYLKINACQKRPNHTEGNFNVYSFRYHDILNVSSPFLLHYKVSSKLENLR